MIYSIKFQVSATNTSGEIFNRSQKKKKKKKKERHFSNPKILYTFLTLRRLCFSACFCVCLCLSAKFSRRKRQNYMKVCRGIHWTKAKVSNRFQGRGVQILRCEFKPRKQQLFTKSEKKRLVGSWGCEFNHPKAAAFYRIGNFFS